VTPAALPATALDALGPLLDLRPGGRDSRDDRDRTRLGVVAGRSGPRFLVPLDFPAASPQACLAYLGLRSRRTQLSRGVVGLALKARLDRVVAREELTAATGPGSLLAHLAEVLADPEEEPGLAVAVGLSRVDDVWKPTLQVFRPDGTPAAFVKIGLGPVGDRLVATEAATLAAWRDHPDPRLVVPDLIATSEWDGLRIAVVAPLPHDARRLPPGAPSAWAVRTLDGPAQEARLADAAWWTSRRAACSDDGPIDELLERIEARDPGEAHEWARWHGDWVPWNLARCHRGLVAWDWEYSEPGAPAGLDEVHGAYQQAHVVEGRPILDAMAVAHRGAGWLADAHVAMLLTRSAELGRLLGRPPADRAELLAATRAVVGRP